MKVADLMTSDPVCCTAQTGLVEIAQRMVDCDCGLIPIVDDDGHPIGVVTDRDIVCRALAQNRNPAELSAQDVMTRTTVTISPDAEVDELAHVLEENQIRRILVSNGEGKCIGIVAQADLARASSDDQIAELLREVSRTEGPTTHAS